jgi:arylsulfatase A-like enzyme/creatinine amidohydrolase/Fe(II)-dependent formamide hydrolase-like protein
VGIQNTEFEDRKHPNVVFVFADQWRASAVGYEGDPNIETPHIDRIHSESISFSNAISNCPICTPYRASLLSGQYPLTTGLFMNDLCMPDNGNSLAQVYKRAGYDTAYIGKWHLDGHGRTSYIPPKRRQGFDYWKVLECTHDYFNSYYYEGNDSTIKRWEGYDAFAQTQDAVDYIRDRGKQSRPFLLMVSYGTPHNPYHTAPDEYLERFSEERIQLMPNIVKECESEARTNLKGYYAHIAALDDCVGRIDSAIEEAGISRKTIFIITSDHGDSVMSHCTPETGSINKQRPYEESIRVPFLLRYPDYFGQSARTVTIPLGAPDIMPTLLELSKLAIPACVEGISFAGNLIAGDPIDREGVIIANYAPFADWRAEKGGREYRGIRTERYTYAKTLVGPWMLYDNIQDPYQMNNLVSDSQYESLIDRLEATLAGMLSECKDDFVCTQQIREQYGYHSLTPQGFNIPTEKDHTWYEIAKNRSEAYRTPYVAHHLARPYQIREASEKLPVAYLGMGILEWHGEHNAVGLDGVKADGIAIRFAKKFGGVVVPPLFWGDYRREICELVFHPEYIPSIQMDHTHPICEKIGYDKSKLEENAHRNEEEGEWQLWIRLATHIFFELESFGYRCIVPIPGHYPLFTPLDQAIAQYKIKGGKSDIFIIKDTMYNESGKAGDHAAQFETSLMMAMYPDLVEMDRLDPDRSKPNIGVLGMDPRDHATAGFGEKILERFDELLRDHLYKIGLLQNENIQITKTTNILNNN